MFIFVVFGIKVLRNGPFWESGRGQALLREPCDSKSSWNAATPINIRTIK